MMKKLKINVPLGSSLVIISSIFYASYGIWTKLMGNFFGGYTAAVLRSILVLAFMLPFAITYHQLEPLNLKRNWRYLLGMVVASLFTWGPLYYAILHAGIGISLTIAYASIVLGMFFFGSLLGKEQFTKEKGVSAVLGIIGLALIFSPSLKSIGLLALIGAFVHGFGAAANSVLSKQIPYNATQSTIVLWVASIASIPLAFVFHEPRPLVGWHAEWFYLVIFAVVSVIASLTFVKGLKLIDAGAAGILGLLEVIFSIAFGVLFFHERPGPIVLLGAIIIIIASAIPYIKDFNVEKGTLEAKN